MDANYQELLSMGSSLLSESPIAIVLISQVPRRCLWISQRGEGAGEIHNNRYFNMECSVGME